MGIVAQEGRVALKRSIASATWVTHSGKGHPRRDPPVAQGRCPRAGAHLLEVRRRAGLQDVGLSHRRSCRAPGPDTKPTMGIHHDQRVFPGVSQSRGADPFQCASESHPPCPFYTSYSASAWRWRLCYRHAQEFDSLRNTAARRGLICAYAGRRKPRVSHAPGRQSLTQRWDRALAPGTTGATSMDLTEAQGLEGCSPGGGVHHRNSAIGGSTRG